MNFLNHRFRNWLDSSSRRRRVPYRRLQLEQLEDRVLLASDFPDVISVGRTLSSWSVADIQDNQLKINYTVYNQQAEEVSGVLLTTTLEPGVSFVNASVLPNRNGQELAWSLGTINAFDRASVTLTVSLTNPTPLQLDTGARGFAMLHAGMVSDDAPAAVLRPDAIAPELLASTPDANTTDPFVQEKAAELDYDPQRIFDYLNTEVGYKSYTGSLRGARGTLWSAGGNSLDEASLGVALLRASGIPARYAHGTLSDPLSKQLILSMFPTSLQTAGYIPAGTEVADPANDPQLLTETRDHYWVQFDSTGAGFVDADSCGLPGGGIGTRFTASNDVFAEVAENMRGKARITLTVEMYSQASAALGVGSGLSARIVLDETFRDVELVGRPITLGHFVSSPEAITPILGAQTNSYTPYLILGDDAYASTQQNTLVTGQNYQEVLTSFPLSSQILTGLFLNVAITSPGSSSQTYTHTIVDRIGVAARQAGQTANLAVDPRGVTAITSLDTTTVGINTATRRSADYAVPNPSAVALQDLTDFARAFSTSSQSEQRAILSQGITSFNVLLVGLERAAISAFELQTSHAEAILARSLQVAAYPDGPRITIASARYVAGASGSGKLMLGMDLRRSTYRVSPGSGQSTLAAVAFNADRGLLENQIEGTVLPPQGLTSSDSFSFGTATSVILDQAAQQHIALLYFAPGELARVAALPYPANVLTRIQTALSSGHSVVIPSTYVTVGGQPSLGWYEIDEQTGDIVGVLEDGSHGAIAEWAITQENSTTNEDSPVARFMFGYLAGFFSGNEVALLGKFVLGAVVSTINIPALTFFTTFKSYYIALRQELDELIELLGKSDPVFKAGFVLGAAAALQLTADPPLPPALIDVRPFNQAHVSSGLISPSADLQLAQSAQGSVNVSSLSASGELALSWESGRTANFQIGALSIGQGQVYDFNGNAIGAGQVAVVASEKTDVIIAGTTSLSVQGMGNVSFYGPAEDNLGVSGDWDSYSAAATGNVAVTLTTAALTLNGTPLPAGTYTIATTAATLTGSGTTASPTFAGSASVTVANGIVELGAGAGNLSVGGQSLNPSSGVTLTGYTGTVSVTAGGGGNNPDAVTLDGNAINVLQVTSTPTTLTTDQNTPVTFQVNVGTSLAGTYTLTAEVPDGWTVAITPDGQVTATPKPGLQNGTFPIRVVALSQTNPGLVAQTTVNVTLTATQPGIVFTMTPDTLFTVPTPGGAQSPTAFRASVRNLGPAADTFTVSVTNLPPGFDLLSSGTSVAVPTGETGILGVYLRPNGAALPAPGTPVSFTVTATSTSNPAITETKTVNFTMPDVHGLTFTATPDAFGTLPGNSVTTTLTLTAVGNVSETVNLSAALSAGLTAAGLPPTVTLTPGQTLTIPVTLTPAATTPLNSSEAATLTAKFNPLGDVFDQTVMIPVRVVAPGVDAIANAAVAAQQLGNDALTNRLNDLRIALTNLAQTPTSDVFKSQSLTALDSILTLLAVDAFFVAYVDPLAAARDQLAAATATADIQAAILALGAALDDFAVVVTNLARHNFTVDLFPDSGIAQPLLPVNYAIQVQNTGTEATTYNLDVSGLPASVSRQFSTTALTVAPGQIGEAVLTLTQTSDTELLTFAFNVNVSVASVTPEIRKSTIGAMQARREHVSVTDVIATPPFGAPGTNVAISAKILNAVNRRQDVRVSFVVRNLSGQQVFASTAVAATLTVQASVLNVALDSLDTTGFAEGQYTVAVSVTDLSGNPIPGGTGQTTLLVGSPISAALTVTPQALPPGTGTVTNTLDITALVAPAEQLKLIGQFTEWLDRGSPRTVIAHDVVVRGNYAYVADDVINTVWNISDPTNPVHVPGLPFGNGGAYDFELADNRNFLVSMTQLSGGGAIRRISLAAPATPSVVSTSSFGYVLASDLLLRGNEAFATTNLVILQRNDITEQFGDLVALDWTVPFSPLHDVLFNTYGNTSDDDEDFGIPRNGGIHNMFGMAAPNASTLYVASTTSTDTDVTKDEFGNPARGIIRIVDITDSKNLVQLGTLEIPGTMMVQQVVVDGNRAYVLGSQGAWRDPYTNPNDIGPVGNIVMAVLDISDPRNPTVMAPPTVLNRAARGHHGLTAIGGKRFVFGSLGTLSDTSQIFLIDASNPANLTVTRQITEPGVGGNMFVDDGHLYVATNVGVFIYSVGVADIPVKAQVQIPKGTGVEVVSGSFNVAPTQIINGTSFDTLVWDFTFDQTSAARTLTWQSTVSNLQPGESRPVTLGSTIDFVAKGTASQVTLPPREVFAGQVLALLAPAAQTVRPAEAAAYTLTVANPTALDVTYDLSVQGVPQAWVALAAQVFVPAGGSVNVPLTLTSDPFAPLTEFGFVVSAAVSGVSSSVQGALTLQGAAVLPPVQAEAHGVVVALTPTQAVAGQGTPALYTVRLTNTGSVTETFRLTTDLPAGFTTTFGQTVVEVPPGASNFRDVTLTVVPALGTTAGDQPFVVTATSTTLAAVRDTASGTATVVASGVNVALSPASGPPNGPFQLTVTNTGQVRDTFDLSLVGPSALVASLDMSQVTLEPGAFKVVPITTSTVDFALPGPLNLMGVAQSITNPAVRVGAAAALSIPATTGLTAHFDPAARVLPLPGTSSFLLLVENTGNTEDSYTATITRTSGPVTANLSGLDGQPTQTIPIFRLPGLSTGAILVQTNLAAVGQGDVRVQVQSLSDPTRSSIATATVSAVAPADTTPPTSSVAPLPAVSPTTFTVNWSGSDEVGGSGLATFDVFVSDNGGPFTPFLTGTTQTAAAFTGVAGHIYGFSSVATDNAGNRQPMPAAAQASTQVEVPPLPPPSDPPPPSGQRPASLRTTIGVVSPRGGFGQPPATWYLRHSNSPGTPDTAPFAYGFQDWVWLSGDWNGDRVTTLGVFDPVGQFGQPPATWYLRDSNSQGVPDVAPFAYGGPNWIPVAGDWDGDGVTTIGVVEPTTMTWYLKNSNSPGAPDIAPFRYGHPGWIPVVGDWDGDGITTIGVYSPNGGFGQPAATWYLRNSNSPGAPDLAPFAYGSADWVPLAGDWDGDGSDSIGVFDPFGQFGQAAATWYLKNSNSPGAPDYGPFAYGAAGWRPVVGDWDGLDAFLRTDGAAFARRAVPAALTRSGSLDLTSVQQNETASAGAALARSPAVAPKPRHSPGSREREAPDEAPERQAATLDAGAQSLAALDAVFAQLGS